MFVVFGRFDLMWVFWVTCCVSGGCFGYTLAGVFVIIVVGLSLDVLLLPLG